jgi:hypothetical protein
MAYREIRVRPVVRYIITEYTYENEGWPYSKSIEFGEFDNVDRANVVAYALAEADAAINEGSMAVVEPARKLRIDWTRGPGEPKEAIQWHLSEVEPPLSGGNARG